MKVSYNWLKDYVAIPAPPQELGERLSLIGFELEEILQRRLDYPDVLVGKVVQVTPHPNADRLRVCEVEVGDRRLSIVCGAPNVAEGQKVPVALEGAQLPGGMKVRRAKIRGVESRGMICSEAELGLAPHSDGIWVLPQETPVGKPLAEALQFQADWVLDLGITPNRPDALSHIGIAREVAAVYNLSLRKPAIELHQALPKASERIQVDIQTPEGCPRYAARVIQGVRIGPSPAWLVQRLEAVGMRSINNIVDITNYVMLETGQPLHAFDLQQIVGERIVVRESKEGERFVTLDGKEHTLPEQTVLICDATKPVAIGGIMGGLNSEVTAQTTDILLESAYFNPQFIQRSARALGIQSEAAIRFSRGTDPNGVRYALDRAAQLMETLAGGRVLQGTVDAYPRPIEPWQVPLDVEQINTLLGTSLTLKEMAEILEKLELKIEGRQVWVPTFRPDLTRVADLAEEIARLYGLDNIPAALTTAVPYRIQSNQLDRFVDELKAVLTGLGLQEVITNSMINAQRWEALTGMPVYPIMNPLSADMSGLRNTLLPSLLQVVQHNHHRQVREVRIFEINRVFHPPARADQLPDERLHLAIALSGLREGSGWYSSKQPVDFYDIKGIVEALADKISLDSVEFISYDNFAVEMQSQALMSGKERLGFFGRAKPAWLEAFDLEERVWVAEFSVPGLYAHRRVEKRYRPVPRFPWVDRDLAVVVRRDVEAGQLVEKVKSLLIPDLRDVQIFDVYEGKQIEAGKKSVALRFFFQSDERTLTEAEVNRAMDTILNALAGEFQARLRS